MAGRRKGDRFGFEEVDVVINPKDETVPLAPLNVGVDATLGCGECHSGVHQPFVEEWNASRHGEGANSPQYRTRTDGGCNGCHGAEGALQAWGVEAIVDARGGPHRWRVELCEKLLSLQREDGSWVNEQDRWYEGNPHLVTAYAVLALQTALGR